MHARGRTWHARGRTKYVHVHLGGTYTCLKGNVHVHLRRLRRATCTCTSRGSEGVRPRAPQKGYGHQGVRARTPQGAIEDLREGTCTCTSGGHRGPQSWRGYVHLRGPQRTSELEGVHARAPQRGNFHVPQGVRARAPLKAQRGL